MRAAEPRPDAALQLRGEGDRLVLSGRLAITALPSPDAFRGARQVDLSGLTGLDTAGAWLLDDARRNGAELVGLPAGLRPVLDAVAAAPWFAPIVPFHFGAPMFDPVMILTMVLVMFVTMIESTGMFLALGDICERKVTPAALSAGLRADGLGTAIGGIFNTFPYTSFSQNVGLVGVTGVRSRFVCVAGGAIMIALG